MKLCLYLCLCLSMFVCLCVCLYGCLSFAILPCYSSSVSICLICRLLCISVSPFNVCSSVCGIIFVSFPLFNSICLPRCLFLLLPLSLSVSFPLSLCLCDYPPAWIMCFLNGVLESSMWSLRRLQL